MWISLGTRESTISNGTIEVPVFGTITLLYIINTTHKRIFLRIKDSTDAFKPVVKIYFTVNLLSF